MGYLTENDKSMGIPKYFIVMYYLGTENNLKMVDIYKKMVITYSHLCKLLKIMSEKGWLKILKKGRTTEMHLTEKGRKVFISLMGFFKATGLNPAKYYKVLDEN